MAPLILVTPCQQAAGTEFADASISLSNRYTQAINDAGGMPLVLPVTATRDQIAELVRRADGVLLTGGEDIELKHYAPDIPPELAAKLGEVEPQRDVLEFALVDEVFRQRKPLLCICRGHQMLNVALGGTLIVDIPTQLPGALAHKQVERKFELVHEVTFAVDSQIAALLGTIQSGTNSTHHQAVARVADALRVTGTTSDGVIETMELKDPSQLPFLQSVQFHPERLYDRHPHFAELFRDFIRTSAGR
ncbi:MAG: gamma-glutamyl-gamma-aminobutyrate hydrolase family protein [Proteobacteria bacterium]|nr:gamma-glutamyl-gamma-aminobutyrate hydrolase family protein [Verrucomicrobiota bacterium]NBU07794.1 gamma-glutamyl-gamma-aminobutyrate hydrolase family protein [Pseudomonadota bacterium]